MIFSLYSHVLGISWQVSVEAAHKILPTLQISRENKADEGATWYYIRWWDNEAKSSCGGDFEGGGGSAFDEKKDRPIVGACFLGVADREDKVW